MSNVKDLKIQYKALEKRLFSLKTKDAQKKAADKLHNLRIQIRDTLYKQAEELNNAYAGKRMNGVVSMALHGGGIFIDVQDLHKLTLYAQNTNDVLSKSWYNETCCISFKKGQEVQVEVGFDVEDMEIVTVVRYLSGGTLDNAKYLELSSRDNLAFFKYPDGRMSGLFATRNQN